MSVPFETDQDGLYRVTEPMNGIAPSRMEITVDGTVYEFSGYRGPVTQSRIYEDTLAYANCRVVGDDDE